MLYIMRHGETSWNAIYKLQGRSDISLNENGREMARKAAVEHANVHFDLCFTSPLKRARETAEIFLENRQVPMVVDERLMELCFGVCEGCERTKENPDNPVYKMFHDPEHYVAPEGAESFEEAYARVYGFYEEMVLPRLREGLDVLIIAHGAINSCLMNQLQHIPLKDFWAHGCNNCELIALEHEY